MATIIPTIDYKPSGMHNGVLVTWTPMTFSGADVGSPFEHADYGDRTVQFEGTIGAGGSISLQGSNDGTNWVVLTDPQGNAITKTAIGSIEVIAENPRYVRPAVTAGDGTTSLTCRLFGRRNR